MVIRSDELKISFYSFIISLKAFIVEAHDFNYYWIAYIF